MEPKHRTSVPRKSRRRPAPPARIRVRARPRLETLEDRTVPSTVLENFGTGSLANYVTDLRALPAAQLSAAAAHDGNFGLLKHDGYDWLIRGDASSGALVHQGDTFSTWVRFDALDGRAYFGFGARPEGTAHATLAAGGTYSLVAAPNSGQLILQNNAGFAHANLGTASYAGYQANHWYKLQVAWAVGGTMTGTLFDSDGSTVLATVTGSNTTYTQGGIAFRAFSTSGHDTDFDSVVLSSGSSGTLNDTGTDPGIYHTPTGNNPIVGGTVPPWQWTNDPGSGIEVQLANFSGLSQVAVVGTKVGLAAGNTSFIAGTHQVGWGPPNYTGSSIPVETPLLAQYLFRQRPGEVTRLIAASDVKHFFSSAHSDFQHLNPGESDSYGSGLNASQSLYTRGAAIDPVTGTIQVPTEFGPRNPDGLVQSSSRTFATPIDYLLQVNIADLDPAQNPVGTHWYLMGNLWVGGEQDVTLASRWEQVTPSYNPTSHTFSFTESGGQNDFKTIPGLQPNEGLMLAGPSVVGTTQLTNSSGVVTGLRISFDEAINPATFTAAKVDSFTVTVAGVPTDLSGSISSITPVSGSGNMQFDLSFTPLASLGAYSITIGPDIEDTAGHPMDQNHNGVAGEIPGDQYTYTFTVEGLRVLSGVPNVTTGGPVSSFRLTFNHAADASTFTGQVFVLGPNGSVSFTVAAVGSGNTVFDLQFATQAVAGHYTVFVEPGVRDTAGHYMDQNNNFIEEEYPGDVFTGGFDVQPVPGLRVLSGVPNVTDGSPVSSFRLTFNHAVDTSTFTGQVFVLGPNGSIPFTIAAVGTGNTVFDLQFATQVAMGHYFVLVEPGLQDTLGHYMDQNNNGIEEEYPGDVFTGTFDVQGPKVLSGVVNSTAPGQAYSIRFTFSRSIDLSSFDLGEVIDFYGPNGHLTITGIVPVAGSNYTKFDVLFAPQVTAGTYTMILSQWLTDIYGNPIDQNGDFIGHEVPGDQYTATFTVSGPHALSATPSGPAGSFNQVVITLDTPVDPGSLDLSQVTLTSSGTPVPITGFSVVPFTGNTQVLVSFGAVPTGGSYVLTVGRSAVTDVYGNALESAYTLNFGQHGYVATATTFAFTDLSLSGSGATALVFRSGSTYADDDYGTIDLGAQHFSFYGRSYSQVYVNSNGGITFGSGITGYPIGDLSTGNPSQASIAPYWSDWVKTAADGATPMILYKLVGSQLIIQWTQIHHYETGGESSLGVTFQAVLDLSNGNITFNYVSLDDGVAGDRDGLNETVGVKDADVGFVGRTVVTHNAANPLIGDHKSIRLTYS